MRSTFTERVHEVVQGIPKGSVLTYQQVARRAGSPNAQRAVGSIMKHNFNPLTPCHRVIRSDYTIGDYNRGGQDVKMQLLRKEGIKIDNHRVIVTRKSHSQKSVH